MSQFKVDSDKIEEAITALQDLKKNIATYKAVKAPEPGSKKSKGLMYDQLEDEKDKLKDSWEAFTLLIDKTIEFLGGANDTFTTADQQSSNAINGTN